MGFFKNFLWPPFFLSAFFFYSCNGVGTAKFSGISGIEHPPVAPPIFLGINSVTNITDSTVSLHWLPSTDAANYHIYDVTSGTPIYKAFVLDPSENSFVLTQLTPDTNYILRLRMLHNLGLVDLNTVDVSFHTNLAPNTPQTPQLSTPLSSPGVEERPIFEIAGVKKDDVVRIYKDDECSLVAGEEISAGSSVLIQVDALTVGTYLFSANAINSLGHASDCSAAVEYERELPPYYPMIESSSDSLLGSTGMNQIINGSADDNSFPITLPFDFYLAGATYTNWYVVSNTYITAGTAATNYSGLNANIPAFPKIMLGAADNSYQQAFTQTGANYFRVRYEGSASTGGTVGAPNIVYELTFFKPTDTEQLIQVTFGQHDRNSGAFGIASASAYYQSAPTITANSSYVLVGNLDGTSWVMHPNSKVIGNGVNE